MKEPGNIKHEDWVKSSFADASLKPPPGAVTASDIARITGYARQSIDRMLKDKVEAGEMVMKEYLVNKHWTKYYLPPEKKIVKPAKRKR